MKPRIYIIAGPNGAGKTTFAGKYLPLFTNSREFVNADEIAVRLCPTDPEAAAIRAGREMLKRIGELSKAKASFSIETTLSGRSYLQWLRKLKASGYEIHLYFLWLPDVELSIQRVADRVKHGGHHIPEAIIRRRYAAGIRLLFSLYRPVVDSWTLFDNSKEVPYQIATEVDARLSVLDPELFEICSRMATPLSDDTLQESERVPAWVPALRALQLAKAEVIEQHRQSGEPLVIWRRGKVYYQPAEEARRELEQAEKNDPWIAKVSKVAPKN